MEPKLKKEKDYWLLRHPFLFALFIPILSVFCASIVSVLIVRLINSLVGLERETGDTMVTIFTALFRILCGVLVYFLMKNAYGKDFCFGFSKRNLKQAFLLCIPAFMMGLSNIPEYLSRGCVLRTGVSGFLLAVLTGFAPGFFEEMALRGGALNNMMIQWKDRPNRVMRSLLASGVVFGVIHLINLVGAGVWETLLQVCYASAVGILFGAVYLRTRNLIALIAAHSFVDFMAELFVETEETLEVTAFSIASSVVIIVVFTVFGLFLVRKEKRREIEKYFFGGTEPALPAD